MKRISFILSLIAVSTVTLFAASCSKDENSIRNIEYIENTYLPTFSYLHSFIGRTDISTIENHFSENGFNIHKGRNESSGDSVIDATIGDLPSIQYQFVYQNRTIFQVYFGCYDSTENVNGTTVKLIRLINNENEFTKIKQILSFRGSLTLIYPQDPSRETIEYQSKDEMLADIQRLYHTTYDGFIFGCNILYNSFSTSIYGNHQGWLGYGISTRY